MINPLAWATGLIALTPIAVVIVTLFGAFLRSSTRVLSIFSTIGAFVSLIGSVILCIAVLHVPPSATPFHFDIVVPFSIDALSAYFMLVVNAVVAVASLHIPRYLRLTSKQIEEQTPETQPPTVADRGKWWERLANTPQSFYVLFNLFHTTMILVMMMDNFFMMWMCIQLTTLTSAPLIGFLRKAKVKQTPSSSETLGEQDAQTIEARRKRQDLEEREQHKNRRISEAAWKYLLISSSGILIALLGILFLLAAFPLETQNAPSLPIINWSFLTRGLESQWSVCATAIQHHAPLPQHSVCPDQGTNLLIQLSFLLIVLGFGTKAGLFPMHTWLPDGHGEAPSPVSALLSGVLIKSALYAILRFYVVTNLALQAEDVKHPASFASSVLLIAGIASLVAAVPFILHSSGKVHFKRVLAQHSLEHMGIITFGFGIGGSIALFGALLHVMNHAFTKALMFLGYGNVELDYEDQGVSADISTGVVTPTGVFRSRPAYGALLALGGLALVGAPPFSVFLSEFIILSGGVQMAPGNPLLIIGLVLFVASILLIFGGMVVHLGRLVLGPKPDNFDVAKPVEDGWNKRIRLGSLVVLLMVILYFGFTVFPLSQLLQSSVTILCKGGACR